MVNVKDSVKIVLKERVERLAENPSLALFGEELRRIQRYDSEEAPLKWHQTIEYVKNNKWDTIDLLRKFGDRKFAYPVEDLERLVNIYNLASVFNNRLGGREQVSTEIPLRKNLFYEKAIDKLKSKDRIKEDRTVNFKIDDKIQGFSLLFGVEVANSENKYPTVEIYGLPKDFVTDKYERNEVLMIGELSLDELQAIGQRRFMYAFATPPVEERNIVEALIDLNNFPTQSKKTGNRIDYKLEEREVAKLNAPRGAMLVFDEAIKAKENGLFKEVKAYELVGNEIPVPDPVIVGFDHFGNRLPLIYWTGDEGLKK